MQINSIKCDPIMTVLKEMRAQELAENLRMNIVLPVEFGISGKGSSINKGQKGRNW